MRCPTSSQIRVPENKINIRGRQQRKPKAEREGSPNHPPHPLPATRPAGIMAQQPKGGGGGGAKQEERGGRGMEKAGGHATASPAAAASRRRGQTTQKQARRREESAGAAALTASSGGVFPDGRGGGAGGVAGALVPGPAMSPRYLSAEARLAQERAWLAEGLPPYCEAETSHASDFTWSFKVAGLHGTLYQVRCGSLQPLL